jgi:hypothetical protein
MKELTDIEIKEFKNEWEKRYTGIPKESNMLRSSVRMGIYMLAVAFIAGCVIAGMVYYFFLRS